jgi:hypothetical protein
VQNFARMRESLRATVADTPDHGEFIAHHCAASEYT